VICSPSVLGRIVDVPCLAVTTITKSERLDRLKSRATALAARIDSAPGSSNPPVVNFFGRCLRRRRRAGAQPALRRSPTTVAGVQRSLGAAPSPAFPRQLVERTPVACANMTGWRCIMLTHEPQHRAAASACALLRAHVGARWRDRRQPRRSATQTKNFVSTPITCLACAQRRRATEWNPTKRRSSCARCSPSRRASRLTTLAPISPSG
jgi:hypothetical protein